MQIEFKGIPSALEPGRAAIEAWNRDRAQLAISSFEPETIAAAADCFPDLPGFCCWTSARTSAGFRRRKSCPPM